ncbi:hypothetical protein [Paenibacillus humicola]|uniref:hypothetical protein n=1 Tax=Paenibacillus humicola TaxID=3110540 RepID=UPI00237A25F7|nr:hypothetical protein [Paenibacillus humicola]
MIVVIAGCSTNTAGPGNTSQENGSLADQNQQPFNDPSNGSKTSPLSLSRYFKNQSSETIEHNPDQLVWKNGDIRITGVKMKQKGPESQILSSLKIQKADKSFSVQLDQKFSAIDSISLSPNRNVVAISLSSGGGSTLLLISLNNGESVDLNDQLESSGKQGVESVQTYNWSPDSETLAFAYGDPSTSSIGLYSLKNKSFTFAPADAAYISTAYLLWNMKGDAIDIVSERPADRYKLYRFDFQKQTIQELGDLTREKLASLKDFGPHYIGK